MKKVPILYIKTSLMICPSNQWTGMYMIETSIMKELRALKFCAAQNNVAIYPTYVLRKTF